MPIPKIHDLVALYTRIANLSLEDLPRKEDISFVNQFYVPTRYPDTFPGSLPEGLPTKEDAQRALDIARQCVSAVIQSIHHGEVTHE